MIQWSQDPGEGDTFFDEFVQQIDLTVQEAGKHLLEIEVVLIILL